LGLNLLLSLECHIFENSSLSVEKKFHLSRRKTGSFYTYSALISILSGVSVALCRGKLGEKMEKSKEKQTNEKMAIDFTME